MNLMSLSAFIRREGTSNEMMRGYEAFLQWMPTLGMFIRCKNENEPLVKSECTELEWVKGGQLLVFNGFKINEASDELICVTDGFAYITFPLDDKGSIIDHTEGNDLVVHTIESLVEYEFELTHMMYMRPRN